MKKSLIKNLLEIILLLMVAFLSSSFSGGGTPSTATMEPAFVDLKEDEPSYIGSIIDDNVTTYVRDISFTGHTSIGGVLKENDDSVNKIELSQIKELEIENPDYTSKKYSDKDVMLAKIITNDGTEINGLLIPRNLVICGIEKNTGIKKAWFLRKIKKITIDKPRQLTVVDKEKQEEEKSILGTIASGFKKISDTLAP